MDRRDLLKSGGLVALGLGALGGPAPVAAAAAPACTPFAPPREVTERLRAAAARPVLRTDRLGSDPVIIESIDVLRRDGHYFIRVRDTDGAEGWTLTNSEQFPAMYPLIGLKLAPVFVGRDARDLEALQAEAYLYDSNYKWQGLALWSCMARLELALLDLLGKRTGLPINRLLGDPVRTSTGVYFANGDRARSAEWVVERLQRDVARSGAKAVKFKLGARMAETEASTARDRKLIPLMRQAFGPDMVLYADANGSFGVDSAIAMGRLLEEHGYGFFEEPVRWDHLAETKQVADALTIPIAGGEQDSSLWSLEWQLASGAIRIVQPDLIYFGGLIRSLRVARMAEVLGRKCVPHISGRGLGSLYVTHFASLLPNTTDYQEYKGDPDPVPYEVTGKGGRFVAVDGRLPVPTAPGLGITFDPAYLAALEPVPA
jgi:L-alanine-DL-glutamate epimerase-like enolase superfamily enzyme